MRVSVDSKDPGFHQAAWKVRVFLAGSERGHVITADEERRWALLYHLDSEGRIVYEGDRAVTDQFWGDVRIETPPGWELIPCGQDDTLRD